MTSFERSTYPRFKRLITARELYVFFTPSKEERGWAEEVTDSDERQRALLLALKSYQRMGCFPKAYDVPDQVVEFVRRAVERVAPDGRAVPVVGAGAVPGALSRPAGDDVISTESMAFELRCRK
jgi:hypothetical protein